MQQSILLDSSTCSYKPYKCRESIETGPARAICEFQGDTWSALFILSCSTLCLSTVTNPGFFFIWYVYIQLLCIPFHVLFFRRYDYIRFCVLFPLLHYQTFWFVTNCPRHRTAHKICPISVRLLRIIAKGGNHPSDESTIDAVFRSLNKLWRNTFVWSNGSLFIPCRLKPNQSTFEKDRTRKRHRSYTCNECSFNDVDFVWSTEIHCQK